MGKIGLAFKAFYKVLFYREVAEQVGRLFRDGTLPKLDTLPNPSAPAAPALKSEPKPARSEALTLLASLQREARFLDLVQEPLAQVSDQEVGAAARDVLRNCATVLERAFDIQPVLSQNEGDRIEIPAGFEPARYRLVGNLTGEPPFHGKLTHHGWRATRCQMPEWSGSKEAALVVAPAEVELS
jgi:hypothetical protein